MGGQVVEEPLIAESQVPSTGAVKADFFGREVLITRVGGRTRAYLDSCPHLGGPLKLEGDGFVCDWHQAEFGLDGRCRRGPARADARLVVLPTRVVDGVVTYIYTPPEGTPGAHEEEAEVDRRVNGAT